MAPLLVPQSTVQRRNTNNVLKYNNNKPFNVKDSANGITINNSYLSLEYSSDYYNESGYVFLTGGESKDYRIVFGEEINQPPQCFISSAQDGSEGYGIKSVSLHTKFFRYNNSYAYRLESERATSTYKGRWTITIILPKDQTYFLIEVNITNIDDKPIYLDEYPTHIHDGIIIFGRINALLGPGSNVNDTAPDDKVYINGVGDAAFAGSTWWHAYSADQVKPFATMYDSNTEEGFTLGLLEWSTDPNQFVTFYRMSSSAALEPHIDMTVKETTLDPGKTLHYVGFIAVHNVSIKSGGEVYDAVKNTYKNYISVDSIVDKEPTGDLELSLDWSTNIGATIDKFDIGNLDNDPQKEIAITTTDDKLITIDDNGTILFSQNLGYDGSYIKLVDINRDGIDEIIVAGRVGDSSVHVYFNNGTEFWYAYLGNYVDSITYGNINNDSYLEVFAGTWGHEKAWSYNGSLIWSYMGTNHTSGLDTYDLDGDGYDEIIIRTSSSGNGLHLLDQNGSVIWIFYPNHHGIGGAPARINNDDYVDIIAYLWYHQDTLYGILYNGTKVWETHIPFLYLIPINSITSKVPYSLDWNRDSYGDIIVYDNNTQIATIVTGQDGAGIAQYEFAGFSLEQFILCNFSTMGTYFLVIDANNNIYLLDNTLQVHAKYTLPYTLSGVTYPSQFVQSDGDKYIYVVTGSYLNKIEINKQSQTAVSGPRAFYYDFSDKYLYGWFISDPMYSTEWSVVEYGNRMWVQHKYLENVWGHTVNNFLITNESIVDFRKDFVLETRLISNFSNTEIGFVMYDPLNTRYNLGLWDDSNELLLLNASVSFSLQLGVEYVFRVEKVGTHYTLYVNNTKYLETNYELNFTSRIYLRSRGYYSRSCWALYDYVFYKELYSSTGYPISSVDANKNLWINTTYIEWKISNDSNPLTFKIGTTKRTWSIYVTQLNSFAHYKEPSYYRCWQSYSYNLIQNTFEQTKVTIQRVLYDSHYDRDITLILNFTFYSDGVVKVEMWLYNPNNYYIHDFTGIVLFMAPGGDKDSSYDYYYYSGASAPIAFPYGSTGDGIYRSEVDDVTDGFIYLTMYDLKYKQGFATIVNLNETENAWTDIEYGIGSVQGGYYWGGNTFINWDHNSSLLPTTEYLYFYRTNDTTPYSPVEDVIYKIVNGTYEKYTVNNTSGNSDTDGDGMPDWWENQYGLDVYNPNDASQDLDGDGLTNLQEYQYGTNATNPDTDSDGIPDGWEVQYGLNATDAGDASQDPDSDGLTNLQEYQNNTDPTDSDTDNDGLADGDEVSVYNTNATSSDTDADGMPDGWEVQYGLNATDASDASQDKDGDGLTNLQEYMHHTNPTDSDTDSDGMPDGWEVQYGLNATNSSDATQDKDNDGLTNLQEYQYGTSPINSDTDGDNLTDGWEINNGLNATNSDTDGDGMPDGWEVEYELDATNAGDSTQDKDNDGLTNLQEYLHGTSPINSDTDKDGMPDGWEVQYGLNATDAGDAALDADNDGLTNLQEYQYGTDVKNSDTDKDGMPDGWEVQYGTNPTVNDASQDADGDGITNYEEYLRGTNPNNANSDGDLLPDNIDFFTGWLDDIMIIVSSFLGIAIITKIILRRRATAL